MSAMHGAMIYCYVVDLGGDMSKWYILSGRVTPLKAQNSKRTDLNEHEIDTKNDTTIYLEEIKHT